MRVATKSSAIPWMLLLIFVAVILVLLIAPMTASLQNLAALTLPQTTLSEESLEELYLYQGDPEIAEMTEADYSILEIIDNDISQIVSNVVIDPAYTHAEEEHPADFEIVRECFAQKGAYMQFQVEKDKRYLRVCIIDEKLGLIAFQIVDIVNKVAKERTAYIKETIKDVRQLLNYARGKGYPRFKGPL